MKDEVMIPQFMLPIKQYEKLEKYLDPKNLGFTKSMLAKMAIASIIEIKESNALRRRQRLQARGEE